MARWKKPTRRPQRSRAAKPTPPDVTEARLALASLKFALRAEADSRKFAKLLERGLAGAAISLAAKQREESESVEVLDSEIEAV